MKGFTGHTRISDKGMGLNFVAPVTLEGTPTDRLDKNEVDINLALFGLGWVTMIFLLEVKYG